MPVRAAAVRTPTHVLHRQPRHRSFHTALLAGASALTLLAAAPAQAGALSQALATAAGSSATANASASAITSAQQATAMTQQSQQNLAQAASALKAALALQAAARTLALQTPGAIPNGLAAGGLQVAPGVGSDPTLWQNADLPTQSSANGQTTVTIQQTAQKSILTWQTFNVSNNTTVHFDQTAGNQTNGNNNWISLNRIQDPSGVPSQILGQIKAEGSVYLINRNGIIFGGSSQVDVHTLIASSLGFLGETVTSNMVPGSTAYDNAVAATNAMFLNATNGGIAAPEATGAGGTHPNLVLGQGVAASSYVPTGPITVDAGAAISTHTNGTGSDGGFVLIAAPTVNNAGTITATDGQIILAAGIGVSLVPPIGSINTQFLYPELTGSVVVGGVDQTPAGSLTNSGLIQAETGNVTLVGTNMNLGGVIGVTTSVSTPGSITISTVDEGDTRDGGASSPTSTTIQTNRRAGQLVVSGVIVNLPEENGQTVPSDGGSFTAGSVNLTGGSVWLQNGSLIEAPGASVGITALSVANAAPGSTLVQSRVYIDNGATIDVAGLADVELPMSATLVTIPLIGANELADSPLLRNSFLNGLKNVVIDSTLSGTTADGLAWVGSPILNASGYVDLIPRTIDQLLTNGGAITLSGGQVMTATGSSLNLDGGYVHYLGGMINTTRLIDAYGRIVDIGNADPSVPIVGIAGQFTVNHAHWNVTEIYSSPLLSKGYFQPDYIQGGNAGTLSVFGTQAVVLDGDLSGQAFAGLKQVEAGLAPSGTSPGGNFLPEGGSFILGAGFATFGNSGAPGGEDTAVIIQDYAPQLGNLSPGFNAATALNIVALNALGSSDPGNILANIVVPAVPISTGGFANVTVTEDKIGGRGLTVAQGTTLAVQPGGSIKLTIATDDVSILGSLIAPAGTISVSLGTFTGLVDNIVVGPDAVISTAGEWVNNKLADAARATTFVNGGSISLSAGEWSGGGGANAGQDTSGSIILQAGSVLDVSSGGVMLANGQLQTSNGIPIGKGGSISLVTYSTSGFQFGQTGEGGPSLPIAQPTNGRIVMDGTIDGWGFAGGGTLTLQALGFQIGGDPTQAPSWDIYLPTNFFAQQGFGSYVLNASYDVTVAPGAIVPVTQQNFIPNLAALTQAPSGANLLAGGLTTLGTLDPYHRQATNLVMTAGGDLNWTTLSDTLPQYAGVANAVTIGAGAVIVADAGANIGLGSPAQVTVLGSIIAPGGSITLNSGNSFEQPGQISTNNLTMVSESVWLGPNAVLDVSGVALVNPFAAPVVVGNTYGTPVTGKVLAGGSVVLSDDNGYVVTEAGSVINVSGASASFDQLQAAASGGLGGQGYSYSAQPVWSNAGSITLATASGLYFDGTINAHAGAPQGQGGTLTILPEPQSSSSLPSVAAVILQQGGNPVPTTFPATSTPTIIFSADELTGSGISTLVVGNANAGNVPVAFAGNVNISLGNAIIINAPQIVALAAGTTLYSAPAAGINDVGTPTVSLSAPYVAINGGGNAPATPTVTAALGGGTLHVNASFIDLENQVALENFGQASFTSSGDIRLSSTNTNGTETLRPGLLYAPGNLTFQAADLYPASGETFIIDATGPNPTTITFLANGTSGVPLSAGGALLVDASSIGQWGAIRAPSGTIVLGIGDKTDTAIETLFGNLPSTSLTDTTSVSLNSGSVTSVSLDGAIIPFGTTIDGAQWQYNTVASNAAPTDLTAPPAKVITINGANVALNSGAVIDLSGGGDLQAIEWVPGTGGTRNVLAQYNVTYPAAGTPAATPLYPDARNVYAIVPSYEAPVAAYDPVYAQVTQPLTTPSGTVTTQTNTIGVGQAALGSAIGQSVYLSGVPGLPAGTYVLLPAQYATLPGAYRVVQNTGASNVVPGQSVTMPDGTVMVSGYYVDALNGARSSTISQFEVQSVAVWQQYSQYTLTSANTFFPAQAISAGTAIPALPIDAGQLALAASQNLILDATLRAAAAPGGAGARVDIASQDIQIVGNGETFLSGYLHLSANSLDALGAGSLLVGGTRSQTTAGTTIDAIANSVVVSNDAADPLTGPEIILVTKTDATGTDPNAAYGLRVDSGSVITASGSLGNSASSSITISGNGALVRVSNGGAFTFTRTGLSTTNPPGLLTVGAGAVLNGGQSLTLDSSDALIFDPAANFSGASITVDAGAITFTGETGSAAAALPGFVIGPNGLAQFANAQQVALRSYGSIGFVGDVTVDFSKSVDLSAGVFTSDGDAVVLNAPQIAFTNELGAPVPASVAGTGSLTVNAGEIDFGTGSKTVSGFGAVTANASGGIVGQGTGTFDFGALPVTLNAPVYLADTSSNASIKTSGVLNLNAAAGTALTLSPVGGAISFIGGTVNDNGATIMAPAGNVSLEATSGDLTVASGSLVSSAGVAKQFFDVTEYAPAGAISLTADTGNVNVQAAATLDFSGAPGGGAAGSLTLSAPQQVVNLNGTLKGGAAPGYLGGSFSLNSGGAVDLDNLAAELASSGVNDAIEVQTGAGNLVLSAGNTLTAHSVLLVADVANGTNAVTSTSTNTIGTGPQTFIVQAGLSGFSAGEAITLANADGESMTGTVTSYNTATGALVVNVTITSGSGAYSSWSTGSSWTTGGNIILNGTINASGIASGSVGLYGKSGVDIEGALIATGSSATQQGGTVEIGTVGVPNTVGGVVQLDPTYGYELVSAANSGVITLGANAVIEVSGGTAGGLSGGTVNFRAPLLDNGDVNIAIAPTAIVRGSRSTTLEAFAVWSTTDPLTNGAAEHFDGIVDPAGWYGDSVAGAGQPGMVAGTWTDQNGNPLPAPTAAQLATYLANDYFTPTNANTDHQAFYGYQSDGTTPGTLMGFVENFPLSSTVTARFAAIPNLAVTPGIELDNPSPAINNGNISILTNWNLGAGVQNADGSFTLAYRYKGQAPAITFRAEDNVEVNASLTDGFFQIANPVHPGALINVPSRDQYGTYAQDQPLLTNPSGNYGLEYGFGLGYWVKNGGAQAPGNITVGDPDEIKQYYSLWAAYAQYLTTPVPQSVANLPGEDWVEIIFNMRGPSQPGAPTPPSASAQEFNASTYLVYLSQYAAYVSAVAAKFGVNASVTLLAPPIVEPVALINTSTVSAPAVTDNTPSPIGNSGNPLPLLGASLAGNASSSYRIIAGANFSSANPLALQAAAQFANGGGSVTLDDHIAYLDTNSQAINVPTMIRTGTGSIDIAAANSVSLLDTTAPGVIYTAGAPAAGTSQGSTSGILLGSLSQGGYDLVTTNAVNPDAAGDISIYAQNDITGVESVSGAGVTNNLNSQFWWQWMQTGNVTGPVGQINPTIQTIQTSINFGAFDQGVMSVGGNVSISAGRNITNLAVSLPTTWYLTNAKTDDPTVNTVGGGNLTVTAGGNILSGDFFVANGTGTLTAGGLIGSSGLTAAGTSTGEVSTILAAQNGVFNVSARLGVDIGGVVDPSYIQGTNLTAGYTGLRADAQSYSAASALNVISTTGDVALNSLSNLGLLGVNPNLYDDSYVLPATVNLTAFTGGIAVARSGELYPSAIGQLSLIADQSITVYNVGGGVIQSFGLIDASTAALPSPLNPMLSVTNEFDGYLTSSALIDHSQTPPHANDTQPVRIYSLTGSITNGVLESSGLYDDLLQIAVDKPALIQAGANILNLAFLGQNLRADDLTRILAGRDIDDAQFAPQVNGIVPSLQLGGPGTFDIEAGRNIGPLTNQTDLKGLSPGQTGATGIEAIGNSDNPYLPHDSANVQVLFGTGLGIDDTAFVAAYIAPGASIPGIDTTPDLIAFMEQYDEGLGVDTGLVNDKPVVTLTAAQAWQQFQALPVSVQQLFSEQILFKVLATVGQDYNNAASAYYKQYSRGYQAINTLFPASSGYTANSLNGGANGASQLVTTGNLDIRSTTIQTQQGGNVSILGPGGQALVGSSSAPPATGTAAAGQGILTLEQGNVNIFTDQSLLLAQSRVFTEQGGDMVIWSSNGDINAGKGAKTIADVPPPQYVSDNDHYNTLDARGEVTGAGIATLQTIPGAEPGSVYLIAPRGTVDAGAAGIRVSGDLFVAALTVLNANNIQVQGASIGVPQASSVNVGALTTASNTAGAASAVADQASRNSRQSGLRSQDLPSIITIEVIGYGGAGTDQPQQDERRRKRQDSSLDGYDPNRALKLVGNGRLTEAQARNLTEEERNKLNSLISP